MKKEKEIKQLILDEDWNPLEGVPDYSLSGNLKDARNFLNPKKYLFKKMRYWSKGKDIIWLTSCEEINRKIVDMPDIHKKLDQMMLIIQDVKKDVQEVKEDVGVLKTDMVLVKEDIKVLKEDMVLVKEDIKVLKKDVKVLKEDMVLVKEDIKVLKKDVAIIKSVPIIKAAFENQ